MITMGERNELAPEIVDSMHAFRNEVFVRRLGWSVPMIDGVERDQYDNENAIYFVMRDASGGVTACARLLPTMTPCMLSDLFSELLGSHAPPHDPTVWELSRFAASVRKSGDGRVLSLSQQTLDLLEAVFEFARQHGVEQLALVTSVAVERLLIRGALDVRRVAAPRRMPDGLFVALYIRVPSAAAS